MERHLVVNGVTIKDTGSVVDVTWHYHVSSSPQWDKGYQKGGVFSRRDYRYVVWVSRRIQRVPDVETMRRIVLENHAQILNPFGVSE